MKKFESLWTPFIWTDDLKTGCKTIAAYTVAMSFLIITFIIYQMRGGDSTQLWNPLLEYDVRWGVEKNSMQVKGTWFILCFFILVASAAMMVHGVRIGVRGWLLPWLYCWGIVCLYQLWFGLWLLWAYYIHLQVVYIVIVDYLWMAYHIYLGLVVWSMYKIIEELQSPNIELLWP